MARLTLYGMIQWDNTLLSSGMILPNGMDNSIMESAIISYAGDLYPYYQVPAIIKQLSGQWFARRLHAHERMYSALMDNYNPLHNYDRMEEHVETPDITHAYTGQSGQLTSNTANRDFKRNIQADTSIIGSTTMDKALKGEQDSVTANNSSGQTSSSDSGTQTDTQTVSAFDSAAYVPRQKNDISKSNMASQTTSADETGTQKVTHNDSESAGETVSQTGKNTNDETDTENSNQTSSINATETHNQHESGTRTTNIRAYGNIGVTTSQDMLQAELNLRTYDIYAEIADAWINEFIVTIY